MAELWFRLNGSWPEIRPKFFARSTEHSLFHLPDQHGHRTQKTSGLGHWFPSWAEAHAELVKRSNENMRIAKQNQDRDKALGRRSIYGAHYPVALRQNKVILTMTDPTDVLWAEHSK